MVQNRTLQGDIMASEITRRPRMSAQQIARLRGLLPMEYKATELARAIGCHRSTIYESYVPNGCPHRRDKHGHLWIEGLAFVAWARALIVRSKYKLEAGQAFCLHCQKPVAIQEPQRSPSKSAVLVRGRCPNCYREVARFESPDGRVG